MSSQEEWRCHECDVGHPPSANYCPVTGVERLEASIPTPPDLPRAWMDNPAGWEKIKAEINRLSDRDLALIGLARVSREIGENVSTEWDKVDENIRQAFEGWLEAGPPRTDPEVEQVREAWRAGYSYACERSDFVPTDFGDEVPQQLLSIVEATCSSALMAAYREPGSYAAAQRKLAAMVIRAYRAGKSEPT